MNSSEPSFSAPGGDGATSAIPGTGLQTAVGVGVLLVAAGLAVGALGIPGDSGYGGVGPNFLPWVCAAVLALCGGLLVWEARSGGYRAMGEPSGSATADWSAAVWVSAGLLLNAALVFRKHVAPVIDARAWLPFLQTVLVALADQSAPPTLVLWGKIAEQLKKLPETSAFPQALAEHPYNLSFIGHQGMQGLFGPMELLQKRQSWR